MISLSKSAIRRIRSLQNPKGRKEHQLFVAEGARLVEAALEAHAPVELIVLTEGFLQTEIGKRALSQDSIPVATVGEEVFRRLSSTEHPQGVLCTVRMPGWPQEAPWKSGLMLALGNVRDPGNLGTIWRTAAWFGVERIVLGSGCVDPHNPKVVRATMGGLFYVPGEPVEDLANWLAAARAAGFRIIAADVRGELDEWPTDLGEAVLVAGGETHGLSSRVTRIVETTIRIPRWGAGDSLNVAMAVSILLDRWRRATSR